MKKLTSSLADFLVRTSALPVKVPVSPEPEAVSGLSSTALSKKSARRMSSPKTFQPFDLADWTKFSGHSLRSGMMQNGIVSPLPPLALLTAGTEFGSSPIPTPTASTGGPNHNSPTTKAGKRFTMNLAGYAQMWPTPRATDGAKGSRTLEGAEKELARGKNVDLGMAVKLWPTPQAGDYRSGDNPDSPRAIRKREQGWSQNLNDAVLLPTPCARDWKDNGKSPAELARNTKTLATHAGGQLNPTWVEWLMGFPDGWTDLSSSGTP